MSGTIWEVCAGRLRVGYSLEARRGDHERKDP